MTLKELERKYGNNTADYIDAKSTIANIEQEYWQELHDEYFILKTK